MNISNLDLPKTDTQATVTFPTSADANDFAKAYTRKTLMGHTVKSNEVTVYNVTDDCKAWIDTYIEGF